MPASKYHRPLHPSSGLVLQPRDRAVLRALYEHRFMRSEHLHLLLFAGVSPQALRRRLRLLWEHELVDRFFVPFLLDGMHEPPAHAGAPIYALAPRGLSTLLDEEGTPQNAQLEVPRDTLATTLAHDLVATDLFVALAVACRGREDVELVAIEHEGRLRRRFSRAGECRQVARGIVPDGAFTLSYPQRNEQLTFYVEVVRAGVRGGNERLRDKLERYTQLHHDGWFTTTYGHDRVRAVLFLTTSVSRTEHFRTLAHSLRHGRRLLWFDSYQVPGPGERPVSTLTSERILDARWQTGAGETLSFIPAAAAPIAVAG